MVLTDLLSWKLDRFSMNSSSFLDEAVLPNHKEN